MIALPSSDSFRPPVPMSPFDLTNLAALKAWLGLPAAAFGQRRDARRAGHGGEPRDSCGAVAPRPAAAGLHRADGRRPPHADAAPLAGAAGRARDLERNRRSAARRRQRQRRVRLRAAARRPRRRPARRRRSTCSASGRRIAAPTSSSITRRATRSSARRRRSPPPRRLTLAALAPYGPWASDLGVTYAESGAPLTAVAAAPAAGQYSVAAGVYSFAAADAGASISLSYGYVPQDLAQAALELAAERFRAAEHIGVRSKSLGGQETIAFDSAPIFGPGAGADPAVSAGGGLTPCATLGPEPCLSATCRLYQYGILPNRSRRAPSRWPWSKRSPAS